MLAKKKYVMWASDKAGDNRLRVCEKVLWNDYAEKFVMESKPTKYRLVMESDDEKELLRFAKLTNGG